MKLNVADIAPWKVPSVLVGVVSASSAGAGVKAAERRDCSGFNTDSFRREARTLTGVEAAFTLASWK